jgi:hypothetical protein
MLLIFFLMIETHIESFSPRKKMRTICGLSGISQSPFDLDDKEVAESMSCPTNYPLQFEARMRFDLTC